MDLKLEALFTMDNPTPERLLEIKRKVYNALTSDSRDIAITVDFAATEFLKERQP